MSEKQRAYLIQAVVVVLALVAGAFGVVFPIVPEFPAPLDKEAVVLEAVEAVSPRMADIEYRVEELQEVTSFAVGSYQTNCYREQGGDKWVCGSGGEMEFLSGSTLDVQAGATVIMAAGATQGNTIITGTLAVSGTSDLVGVVSSSTGAVTVTDALQVNGNVVVTGTLDASGATTLNSTLDVDGAISSGTGAVTVTDSLQVNGNETITGTLDASGATTLNSTLDVDGAISSGTGAVTVTDALQVNGNATITGTLDVSGDATLGALLLPGFADETITDGEVLTPTVTVYALDSAGAVTMTLAAVGTEGQLLILIGDDANDITVADTNVRTNDGNAQVINQYDVIMWVFQDSEWMEISESDNS